MNHEGLNVLLRCLDVSKVQGAEFWLGPSHHRKDLYPALPFPNWGENKKPRFFFSKKRNCGIRDVIHNLHNDPCFGAITPMASCDKSSLDRCQNICSHSGPCGRNRCHPQRFRSKSIRNMRPKKTPFWSAENPCDIPILRTSFSTLSPGWIHEFRCDSFGKHTLDDPNRPNGSAATRVLRYLPAWMPRE